MLWFLPSSLHCCKPFVKLNNKYAGAQHLETGEPPVLRGKKRKKQRKKKAIGRRRDRERGGKVERKKKKV